MADGGDRARVPDTAPSPARLVRVDTGAVIPLAPGGAVTIGRDRACSIRIPTEGLSRRHARLRSTGGSWVIEDLGSTNGVRVNGLRVPSAEIRSGDRVQIGPIDFRFEAELEAVPPVPAPGARPRLGIGDSLRRALVPPLAGRAALFAAIAAGTAIGAIAFYPGFQRGQEAARLAREAGAILAEVGGDGPMSPERAERERALLLPVLDHLRPAAVSGLAEAAGLYAEIRLAIAAREAAALIETARFDLARTRAQDADQELSALAQRIADKERSDVTAFAGLARLAAETARLAGFAHRFRELPPAKAPVPDTSEIAGIAPSRAAFDRLRDGAGTLLERRCPVLGALVASVEANALPVIDRWTHLLASGAG